ncbi:DHH family phosphoesterase [Candidatus Dojkabacteria bacterium]|uniref:DHH family phosphoesterase n=1 Tax=Candidatus Dojkabacteria bacterium TaxID=2099670 RepID=A0A955RIN8_9BACT|nr:DHH family phosphoesterase [Candidatus Dojkabacteria bacterium]
MKEFEKYIKNVKSVLLITSQPLDLDCISSGLIMKSYLESLDLRVTFRFPRKILAEESEKFSYLPFFDEFHNEDTRDLLDKAESDLLILLDGTNLVQYYDNANTNLPVPAVNKFKKSIRIDHHPESPENLAELNILDPNASSTIELLLNQIIPESFLDRSLATLAYAGLIGDTGNFRWNFNSKTLKLAASLLEKGADPSETIDRMFAMKRKEYLSMLKFILENIEYEDDLQTVFLFLPYEKFQSEAKPLGDFRLVKDVFVNEVSKSIDGYHRGILLTEHAEKGKIKVNSRGSNQNNIDLREMFQSLGGNGGGHFQTGGGDFEMDFDEFKTMLKDAIKTRLV